MVRRPPSTFARQRQVGYSVPVAVVRQFGNSKRVERNIEDRPALVAPESVDLTIPRHVREGRSVFAFDPATRTYIVKPECRHIVQRALIGHARAMQRGFHRRQLRPQIRRFVLQVRLLSLQILAGLFR